jgi:hypothetical protein
MGILDEAIREHLELKRAHGADDSELKQLEDQAFGQADRPGAQEAADPAEAVPGSEGSPSDPAAEAPTEFMAQPDLGEARDQSAPKESVEPPAPTRREPAAGVTDIQEPPEKAEDEDEPDGEEHGDGRPAAEDHDDEPAAEEQPAAEHEAISAPPVGGHTTEERHAIADQPTEMFDVEEEFASTEAPAPPDEDLVAEELTEARLGPADPAAPPTPAPPVEEEGDDDFFDEQRLSDELDQALEAPIEPEPEPVSDEQEALPVDTDEHQAAPVNTEEHEVPAAEKRDSDEDVLEETPDFLEESPEDDELWFEQKPPKDFDFDD